MNGAWWRLGLVGLWVALASACAMRPMPHQPQPEAGAVAEAGLVWAAWLAAWNQHDESRMLAYVAPDLRVWNGGEAAEDRVAITAWLEARRAHLPKHDLELAACRDAGLPRAFSRYALQHGATCSLPAAVQATLQDGDVVLFLAAPDAVSAEAPSFVFRRTVSGFALQALSDGVCSPLN